MTQSPIQNPQSKITLFWNRLSDFLHHAKLIPLVIMVEGWHYYQVLSSHDTLLAAIPLALFLDLLHVRTVQQAVETKKKLWVAAAVISTAVAYAFQYIFYSTPGHNGEVLPLWEQLLFASVVPLGIAFMVWHHHENAQKVERDLLAELIETQARLSKTQADLGQTQEDLTQTQSEHIQTQEQLQIAQQSLVETQDRLKETHDGLIVAQGELKETQTALRQAQYDHREAQDALGQTQGQLAAAQGEMVETQTRLKQTQTVSERLTTQLTESQEVVAVWKGMSGRMQQAAKAHAGLIGLQEAADIAGVSKETMRRDVVRMKGE